MTIMLVWLLIATSHGSYTRGNVTVLERFKDQVQCEHVQRNIPASDWVVSKCIQAHILVPK